MADVSYKIIKTLKEFGEELDHKYLKVHKKKDAKEFDFTKENLEKLIEKSINKEGKVLFNDLPRRLGFFSSMNEDKSSGLSIGIGGTNPALNNSVTISLPYGGFSGFADRKSDFYNLFKNLVSIFKPYFAFVYNNFNKQLAEDFWSNKPTYVHWLNFYSNATIDIIGKKRIESLDNVEWVKSGCFIKLQDEPIDIENPEHLLLQKRVSEQMELI